MRASHFALSVLVAAIWGTNFVVMHYGLARCPPLMFAALRFGFALLPAIFFIPKPKVAWGLLIAYGVLIGVGQFGLLFIALRNDITPGLASLVIQSQVFFTILLAAAVFKERISVVQMAGMTCAGVGLVIISAYARGAATPLGIILVSLAGMSWAGANIVIKSAGTVSMLSFVTWSCMFATPALIILSMMIEGPTVSILALLHGGVQLWAAIGWQAYVNTLFGYAAWGWLLRRYPAATVMPVGLLVPIFGMGASAILLEEPLPIWKVAAAILVVAGLIVGVFDSLGETRSALPLVNNIVSKVALVKRAAQNRQQ
jgi:O-acetylserine/cysteine efflux transporter